MTKNKLRQSSRAAPGARVVIRKKDKQVKQLHLDFEEKEWPASMKRTMNEKKARKEREIEDVFE